MKLPSLNELGQSTVEVMKRFPLVVLSALIFALFTLDEISWVSNGVCFAAVLGVSLFLGIDLLAERTRSRGLRIVLSALGVAALIVYAIVVGDSPTDNVATGYRFGLFLLGTHLFVSVAAFLRAGGLYAFWEFNKSLFLRFLLSALFSGVLCSGLCVAMLAVDQLLLGGGVIDGETYVKVFLIVGTLFNTLFFLAGVPEDFAALEEEGEYPKGLKMFAQNLLLPLVVLYMSILYVYAASILIDWKWPKGWIGWLVLSFSVLGILALLLLHPLQKREDVGWIRRFTRWFYIAVLPLIGLLFAAIIRRLTEYGITENRYFVVLLAFWLAGMALYFIFSKRKNIKIIPLSLCVAAILSTYGPWSAFSVSVASQAGRFHQLSARYNLLTDGTIDPAKGAALDWDSKSEMQSLLYYLAERKELGRIADIVPGGDSVNVGEYEIAEALGLNDLHNSFVRSSHHKRFSYIFAGLHGQDVLDVNGFDLLLRSDAGDLGNRDSGKGKWFSEIGSGEYRGKTIGCCSER